MTNTDILDEFKEFLKKKEKAETSKEKIEKAGHIPYEDFERIVNNCSITITGAEFARAVSKAMGEIHDIVTMIYVAKSGAALMGELFGEKIYEQYSKEQKEDK